MILMGYRNKQNDEAEVIAVKGNSGGFGEARSILTQEFSEGFEGSCSLHTSSGQGLCWAQPQGPHPGQAMKAELHKRSLSSASAQIPNQALLSEWNEDSKSSFKYYKLPKIMPGNNDISQLDSLLPALNIKQKKTN